MIALSKLSVVMQGDVRSVTLDAIKSVRKFFPGAHLIFSTFEGESCGEIYGLVDEIILSKDPGPLVSFVKADSAPPNNINRQLVSTNAGLARVDREFVLKCRSDCVFESAGALDFFAEDKGYSCDRLLVCSFFTRHPRGLSCYLFHVSDWFLLGKTNKVKDFFSVGLMSNDEARWFESKSHERWSTYAAKRFRARFTPEQYFTVNMARSLGYKVPSYLNERNPELVRDYELFLANEVIVAEPCRLGFFVGKYSDIINSLYLKIDCLGFDDWRALHASHPGSGRKNSRVGCGAVFFAWVRVLANLNRHLIVWLVLNFKAVKKVLGIR
ncbi:WavE lipopolysaccharide synthesis family protein [Zoogloea sp.]|uniref:WavE lipopolysaccharide synthesis family protein n=1 Tax=Zoogloea sp. TaxID=49181 RepID=UPI0035AEEEA0